jgi:imidazolonepropionase-like amidohydrolase
MVSRFTSVVRSATRNRSTSPRATLIGVKNAAKTLQAGFTTVRNVGADAFEDVALRDAIAAGDIDGPRMQVSGPPLGITRGHADENLRPYEYHVTAQGTDAGVYPHGDNARQFAKMVQ